MKTEAIFIYRGMMGWIWTLGIMLIPAARAQAQQVQQSGKDSAMAQADTFSEVIDVILNKLGSWWQSAVAMIPNLTVALLVLIATFILVSILGRILQRVANRVVESEALASLLTTLMKIALLGVGLFVSLSLLNLDKTVTSLLAGAGIVIPNKEVFQTPLENYSMTDSRRIDVDVGVPYDSNLAQVEQVLRDAVDGLSWRMEDKDVSVWCLKFDDSAILWKVGVWMKYPGDTGYYDAKHEAHLAIKKALDEADIIIPLPIRTLHIPDRTIDRLLPHDQQHDEEKEGTEGKGEQ